MVSTSASPPSRPSSASPSRRAGAGARLPPIKAVALPPSEQGSPSPASSEPVIDGVESRAVLAQPRLGSRRGLAVAAAGATIAAPVTESAEVDGREFGARLVRVVFGRHDCDGL